MQSDATNLAARLQQNDPELYEQYILAAVNGDESLYTRLASTLCIDAGTLQYTNEFNSPIHYAIYLGIVEWRKFLAGTTRAEFAPLSPTVMRVQLQDIALRHPQLLDVSLVPEALAAFENICSMIPVNEAVSVVEVSYFTWAQRNKLLRVIAREKRGGFDEPQKVLNLLQGVNEQLQSSEENTSFEFGDGMDMSEIPVERIPLSNTFAQWNSCLGGGFGRGEHVLIIAPTGAGKTVLACQFCSDIALNNRHALLITTEQPPAELEPRIVSACCTIPFSDIKDGGDMKKILLREQYESYMNLRKQLKGWLHFEDWSNGSGKTIEKDLEPTIKKWIAKYGTLDYLCFDWIGAALGEGQDKERLRITYQNAATSLKNMARKYDLAVTSFGQATPISTNKRKITEFDLAENKSLHREATAAFGVSAIRVPGEDEGASYSETQYVHCFKSRKAAGQYFQIKRDFTFQRFVRG